MRGNIAIPKRICPACRKKYVRVLEGDFLYCEYHKCPTKGNSFKTYEEMEKENDK
jgi:translation initiation factor IF-1